MKTKIDLFIRNGDIVIFFKLTHRSDGSSEIRMHRFFGLKLIKNLPPKLLAQKLILNASLDIIPSFRTNDIVKIGSVDLISSGLYSVFYIDVDTKNNIMYNYINPDIVIDVINEQEILQLFPGASSIPENIMIY